MYESCSNRNLFGVVRSRTSNFVRYLPSRGGSHVRDRQRSPTSVRCCGELYDPPVKDNPTRDTRKILGVTDVTKIIVFRNTEGSTTAFDKTFSTSRSVLSSFSLFLSLFLPLTPFSVPFSGILVPVRSVPVARKRVTSGTNLQRRNDATMQLRENSKWFRIAVRCDASHIADGIVQPRPSPPSHRSRK